SSARGISRSTTGRPCARLPPRAIAEPPSPRPAGRMVANAAMNGRVTRVSIAPVKSLGLSHPETVELTPSGVVGDRRFWMITDEGRLVNGKLCPELMQIHSACDEATGRLSLRFPDGAELAG